jgi:hypothetical protein
MPVMHEGAICATSANMIKLTQERQITPYVWVHPDEER